MRTPTSRSTEVMGRILGSWRANTDSDSSYEPVPLATEKLAQSDLAMASRERSLGRRIGCLRETVYPA